MSTSNKFNFRMYPNSKCKVFVDCPPMLQDVVKRCLTCACGLEIVFEKEKFSERMQKEGVQPEHIQMVLESVKFDNETYLTADKRWP